MANVSVAIANATGADVTVNSQVAKAGTVTKLTIDNTTTDIYGFLAAGCAVVSVSAQADLGKRLSAVFDLYRLQHNVI